MANEPDYSCTSCGKATGRELLTVKKVVFQEMGTGGRIHKSRVTHWLCPNCVQADPDFHREPFKAPGVKRIPVSTNKVEV